MLLLHLSDIHFRRGVAGTAMDPDLTLRNEIILDVEKMCGQLGKVDAVLLSGDIAYSGHAEEYQFALRWLEQLCNICGCSTSNVFMCPGNHDVDRNIVSQSPVIQALHQQIKAASDLAYDALLRGFLTDHEASRLLYKSIENYNFFAQTFFCDVLPPERTIARRDLVLNDNSILRLSGFNSVLVSSAADALSQLYIDPACHQLIRERGVEHLVLCHHPFAWLRGGQRLRDHLNDLARLQLFGHEHTNRIELTRD
jgi:DNA repair exonuclease SbcCD nuclease subunit